MKKLFLPTLCLGIFSATMLTAAAQDDILKENKRNEIVIRKKGNKDARITVEIKGEDILVNGKPLSEFDDSDVTVLKRNETIRRGNDIFVRPHGGNAFFYDSDDEPKPLLGVTTEKNDNGVKITSVTRGSAAEKAGLKEGDVITRLGDKKITEPRDLVDAVRSYKPKNEVKISYQRNGKTVDTKAVLGEQRGRFGTFSFNGDEMPGMDADMMKNFKMKDFKFEMPPMPKEPFKNFWMPQNKRLGIKIEDTDDDNGAKITNVEEGSAAAKAGLKKDDIITEVDGDKVKNTDEVRDKVSENEKNNYTIKAKRGAAEMIFEIKFPKKLHTADL